MKKLFRKFGHKKFYLIGIYIGIMKKTNQKINKSLLKKIMMKNINGMNVLILKNIANTKNNLTSIKNYKKFYKIINNKLLY